MFDLPFKLPDGWEVKTVELLIKDEIIEKPLDGNHGGTHPKSADYVEEGVPFVMASDLEAGRVNFDSCKFITEKQALTLRKGFSKVGDVLVSHKATIGRTAIVQDNEHDFVMLTPQVTYYRVKNSEKLNNVYLKAYFDSSFFQTILGLWAGAGSTRAYLGITAQLKLPVIVPPIGNQLSIANHVSAINDKIELNCQTNQTLEQIAQAIFKSWFVDFEPVKAKIQAKQEWARSMTAKDGGNDENAGAIFVERAAMCAISGKTDTELDQLAPDTLQQLKTAAALFPDALVESEVGEIPEGWENNTIDDVTSLIIDHRGKTPKKLGGDWVEEGYPAVSAKNIKDGRIINHQSIRFLDKELYSKWMKDELKIGDILLTSEAPMGEMYFLTDNSKFCLSQRLYALRADDVHSTPSYLYLWLQTAVARADVEGRATGTTVVGIRQSELRKVNVLSPAQEIIKKFEETVFPMFRQLYEKERENLSLSDIRDGLLPKLLSGSLREVA